MGGCYTHSAQVSGTHTTCFQAEILNHTTGVHCSLTPSRSWIFCKSWQPFHCKKNSFLKTPHFLEILDPESTVLKLQRNRFGTLIPHVFCLSRPGLFHFVLSGSGIGRAALQGGTSQEPRAIPANAMPTLVRAQSHSTWTAQAEQGTGTSVHPDASAENSWSMNQKSPPKRQGSQQTTSNTSPQRVGQTDGANIAQEGFEGSGLSLNRASGPVVRGHVGLRSQVRLLRAINAY